jgi:hypothetical protein
VHWIEDSFAADLIAATEVARDVFFRFPGTFARQAHLEANLIEYE